MFSFLKRSHTELGAVFDIGSSSIGVALVKFEDGVPPHIVYTHREHMPYRDTVDPERFLSDMILTLGTAHSRLHKEGLAHLKFTEYGNHRVKRALYAFSSPWAASQTKIASVHYTDPTEITEELVRTIIASAEQAFEAEVIDPANDPAFKEKLSVIDRRVVQVRLNGYEVGDPYGKKARDLSVSFFISLVPKLVIDRVSEASLGALHPKRIRHASSQLATYSVLRDALSGKSDFIILDVGGEVSDLSVVKDGLILETASFPLGKNFLTRRVSRALSVTNDGALSLLKLYYGGHADASVSESLNPVIDNAAREWVGALHTTLTRIAGTLSLPQDLAIVIGGDLVPFFMRAIREEKITQFDIVDVPFRSTLVNHELLRSFVSFSSRATKDPSLSLISIFAARHFDEQ